MVNVVFDKSNKYRTCIILFLITSALYAVIFHIFPTNHVINLLRNANGVKEQYAREVFRPVTLDGVFTFSNVCLEPLITPSTVNIHGVWFNITQRIVIYDRNQSRLGNHRLAIAGPTGNAWNYYDVYFTSESLPLDNIIL